MTNTEPKPGFTYDDAYQLVATLEDGDSEWPSKVQQALTPAAEEVRDKLDTLLLPYIEGLDEVSREDVEQTTKVFFEEDIRDWFDEEVKEAMRFEEMVNDYQQTQDTMMGNI